MNIGQNRDRQESGKNGIQATFEGRLNASPSSKDVLAHMISRFIRPSSLILIAAALGCQQQTSPQQQTQNQPTASPAAPVVIEATPAPTPEPGGIQPGEIITTESGLKIEYIEPGAGRKVRRGDRLELDYVGTLDNGFQFDANSLQIDSAGRGFIKGFNEAVLLLREGAHVKVSIPPELAYGALGQDEIPPNATIHFDLKINRVIPVD